MSGLAALYQQCIFRSREQMETHGLVAAELSDHHLHWEAGRVDTRLYKFDTPGCRFIRCDMAPRWVSVPSSMITFRWCIFR
ncbi:hypothetical protein ACFSS8_09020 [Paracoccus kondratievae]